MHSVVVLDRRWQYHREVRKKSKVVKWLDSKKAKVLVPFDGHQIRGLEISFPMPLVLQLVHYPQKDQIRKVKRAKIDYSPEEIFKRDNNQCQYYHYDELGKRFVYQCTELDRTIDHVIPKISGGETCFENCVCCCRWHNVEVKKDHLLKDVGLELIRKPFVPIANVGDEVVIKFVYNPMKIAHKVYMEKVLNRTFSSVVAR